MTLPAGHTSIAKPRKDQTKDVAHVVARTSAGSASSSELVPESGRVETLSQGPPNGPNSLCPESGCAKPVTQKGPAGPSSLCPVVAFASFAAQLSFKMVLHLAVFGGGCRHGVLGGYVFNPGALAQGIGYSWDVWFARMLAAINNAPKPFPHPSSC
jgi:hypothetical protein